jgi:phosphoglucosamine mutase
VTRIFGTDGVRGLANGLLTAELALDLSVSAAHVLAEHGAFEGHRPFAVVGRDTRISGQFLEAAVVAGLASAGVDVLLLGELPTPGVAHLTASLGADLGVMLSASHNAMPDNGIKFLARGGVKLDDSIEDVIESRLREPWDRPTGAAVGRVTPHATAIEEYVDHLVSTVADAVPPAGQRPLKVVLDCAHGAASVAGPKAVRAAGHEVVAICAEPDGLNINDGCGSTHLEVLQKAVVEHGADVGFAFDGDADRCLDVDASGNAVDGDQILAILGLALHDQGRLAGDTIVATVMSNLGFVQAMTAAGVTVRQTAVGDRYVLEDMKAGGYCLGGEQSGHVIMSDYATTGDGVLTALQVLRRMTSTGKSIAELAGVMTRLPQVLVNVGGVDRSRTDDAELVAAVAAAESELAGAARARHGRGADRRPGGGHRERARRRRTPAPGALTS